MNNLLAEMAMMGVNPPKRTPSIAPSQERRVWITPEFLENLKLLSQELAENHQLRNQLKRCPICHSNISDRTVSLYRELIDSLYKIYVWCGKNRRHEFETKDITQFLGKNEYARFGDLVRFGGIVYKPKDDEGNSRKAWFGLNMARAKEFFSGKRQIPVQITLNQITNEIVDAHYVSISDFPSLSSLITAEGLYDYEKLL